MTCMQGGRKGGRFYFFLFLINERGGLGVIGKDRRKQKRQGGDSMRQNQAVSASLGSASASTSDLEGSASPSVTCSSL